MIDTIEAARATPKSLLHDHLDGGLRVDTDANVLDKDLRAIPGLYAAGELVGGIFYHNYPGGTGLMSGAVFGKIAGTSAATKSP